MNQASATLEFSDGTLLLRNVPLTKLHEWFGPDIVVQEPECPQRRIDAFCKLLEDVSTYRRSGEMHAAELRRKVFRRAAAYHPLVAQPDRLFDSGRR